MLVSSEQQLFLVLTADLIFDRPVDDTLVQFLKLAFTEDFPLDFGGNLPNTGSDACATIVDLGLDSLCLFSFGDFRDPSEA